MRKVSQNPYISRLISVLKAASSVREAMLPALTKVVRETIDQEITQSINESLQRVRLHADLMKLSNELRAGLTGSAGFCL